MDKTSITQNISSAFQVFVAKHGTPPQILETSLPFQEVVLPEGLQLVVRAHRLPKNILLLGVEQIEENEDE